MMVVDGRDSGWDQKSFRGNVEPDGRHSPSLAKGSPGFLAEEGTGVTITAEGRRACFPDSLGLRHWGEQDRQDGPACVLGEQDWAAGVSRAGCEVRWLSMRDGLGVRGRGWV